MIHEARLLESLSALETETFSQEVFRATRLTLDPIAPSTSGGRWAPPADSRYQLPVLYTSLDREGALAEISYHWAKLRPLPSKPVVVHRLKLLLERAVVFTPQQLEALGVDALAYTGDDVARCQEIGAACAFLGYDGIIIPSARWACQNAVVFTENHGIGAELQAIDREEVQWQSWAKNAGILRD